MAAPAEFRDRILDAARVVFVESPGSDRVHALIADRAGVSRPTVYKYVGDQHAIKRALLERETFRYLSALGPVLAQRLPLREHFGELVVFTVVYFRGNDLFAAMLDTEPATLTRALTVDLPPLLREGTAAAASMLHELHPTIGDGPVPLHLVIEWGIRISLSLLTTPSPFVPLDSPSRIRAHVDNLFAITAPAVR